MKKIILALVTALAGVAALLAGLGADAWLHGRDATLAEREGIFTLSNPGHGLLGIGLAMTCGGVLAALWFAWGTTRSEGILGRRWVRLITLQASGGAMIGAMIFALSISASNRDDAPGDAAGAAAAPHTHAAAPEVAPDQPVLAEAADTAAAHAHPEPTADERDCFAALTAEAKTATARFADITVARAEGYVIAGDPAKTHMPNRAYMRDGTSLDLARPETLVYVMRNGERVFAGAMYRAPKGQGPTPCGAATSWHTHGRCVPPLGEAIPENKDKTCPAGFERRDGAVEMMHVWFIARKGG